MILRIQAVILMGLCFLAASCRPLRPGGDVARINIGTSSVIVVDQKAPPAEQTAARELADYMKKITGVSYPVITNFVTSPLVSQIVVGRPEGIEKLFPHVQWDALSPDTIVMKTTGNTLLLSGGRPRGSLYAVYTFLEEVAGVRWWTADASFVPQKDSFTVGPMDITYTPDIACRETFYRDAVDDPVFAARMRLNGHHHNIPEAYGGHYSILGWCHTFYTFLPPSKYFQAHPEWYSLVDGKRTHHNAQLCLTNEEMQQEFIRVVLEKIAENPVAGIISVSQNDHSGACECPACQALTKEEGAASGPIIHFVNKVADAVAEKYPDFLVETLAYQYSRKPPQYVKPRSNVLVRLCSIECDFGKPIATGENNAGFRDDMMRWSEISDHLYVWDYIVNFANYMVPHPNLYVLGPNLRFFRDHHTVGMFEQGDLYCSVGDLAALRCWLVSKLMWDPDQDDKALIEEFINGYYGAAAPYVSDYVRMLHTAIADSDIHLGMKHSNYAFLSVDDMNRGWELWNQAEEAVARDPVLADRISRDRMSFDHLVLVRYDFLKRQAAVEGKPFLLPDDRVSFTHAFMEKLRTYRVDKVSEAMSLAEYEPQLKASAAASARPPVEVEGLLFSDWYDIQEKNFSMHNVGQWVKIVDDPSASNGQTARMPGDHSSWAIQYPIKGDLLQLGRGEWRFYVVLKYEAEVADGNKAAKIGLFDPSQGRNVKELNIKTDRAHNGRYVTYDLGAYELVKGMYLWAAPPGNNADLKAVSIDRFFLVKEKQLYAE